MAGRGPAPKDPGSRARRNRTTDSTTVEADDVERGPALPSDYDWPDATLTWWSTWRKSAQAATFTPTDWDFLLDTAMLHANYWKGNLTVAGELRLRVAKFGATPEDRARLKIEVEQPGSKAPTVSRPATNARRSRLLKVVDAGGA